MYTVVKTLEIAGAHSLFLDYQSKCQNFHGHNWIITVCCRSKELNKNGMVIDFSHIKEIVHRMDHENLNELLEFNPTAENIAKYLQEQITHCYKVKIQESDGNTAIYEI